MAGVLRAEGNERAASALLSETPRAVAEDCAHLINRDLDAAVQAIERAVEEGYAMSPGMLVGPFRP